MNNNQPASDHSRQTQRRPGRLPFSRLVPFACGAVLGLFIRLVFAGWVFADARLPDVMSWAFLFGTPVAVGAATVFVAERTERRSWGYCIFAPWLSVLSFAAGTALVLIEGLICIAMAMPIFIALGSVGGMAAGIAVRMLSRPMQQSPVFALLPFVMAAIESGTPTPDHFGTVEASTEVAAPPEVVWQHLNAITDITVAEVANAWIYKIGVPRPLEGVTSESPSGKMRVSRWDKGVQFRERIVEWQPAQYMRWTYEFDADSFPAGALDDHVVIGGRYFDLLSTSYQLQPLAKGTRVTIQTQYRVTTGFNWYADTIAQLVLRDFSEAILGVYRARSEGSADFGR